LPSLIKAVDVAFLTRKQRSVAYAMTLALLLLVSGAVSLFSWNSAVERHDRELETMAIMGMQAVDTYFSTLEKSLADLGERIIKEGPGPHTRILLENHKRRYPEFEIVILNLPDGTVYATSEGPTRSPPPNIGREPSFVSARDALLRGERMVVSRPFLGPVTKTLTTPLRYGVRDASGRLLFLLGGGLSQARTHAFWKDAPLQHEAAMGLIRDDLYIVARHPLPPQRPTRIFTERLDGLLSDFLTANNFPASGMIRGQSRLSGTNVTVAFRRLPHYPLTFYVNNPQSNLRADWWAAAWPTYLLILVLFGGGLLIIRWIGRRQAVVQREREARVSQLTEITQKLESSNAELEAFMYSVSHDLRAPIRAIDGYSALLREELALPEKGEPARLFGRIRANTRRMSDLLNDLLDLSRYSTKDLMKEQIDMREIVDSVVAELHEEAAGARFEIGELPRCSGDRVLLRQVWSNLIANAIKYSARAPAPLIRIGFADGAYFVADNGSGFDMAYAGKLFKLFSRLHADHEYEGTGVGLAIVKRIVERHGGKISAEGVPGAGARFAFSIGD
jgi:signal transduction histidine kinase